MKCRASNDLSEHNTCGSVPDPNLEILTQLQCLIALVMASKTNFLRGKPAVLATKIASVSATQTIVTFANF